MEIKRIVTAEADQNCYLLCEGKKGILIDPGIDTMKIIRETEGYEIGCILLTHCHFDHVWSLNELRHGRICAGSKKCSDNIINPNITLLPPEVKITASCDKIIGDGETFSINGIEIKCIYTPGHTDGSVCYLIGGCLFTGDTLFFRNVGRTDLPTGNFGELENSVKNKLYTLPDETKVYPGHGRSTTIGFEKKNNAYITE